MKACAHVKISKLATVVNPVVETANWDEYVCGSAENTKSPPIEYYIKGHLIDDIQPGQGIHATRYDRNGVAVPGIFRTSSVTKIEGNQVSTTNSIYLVEEI